MDKFLVKCIKETIVKDIEVGNVYCVERELEYKIIYNETKNTFEFLNGNKEWFYEHFKPLRCFDCVDMDYCNIYKEGREYACYGFKKVKEI